MKTNTYIFYPLSLKSSERGTTGTSLMQNSAVTQQSTRKLFPFMPGLTLPDHKLTFANWYHPALSCTITGGSEEYSGWTYWIIARSTGETSLSEVLNQKPAHPVSQNYRPLTTSPLAGLTPILTCISCWWPQLWPQPCRCVPPCSAEAQAPLPSPRVMLHLGQPCPKGTLLVHGHLVPQDPQVLLCQAALQLDSPRVSWCRPWCLPRGRKLLSSMNMLAFFSRLVGSLSMVAKPSHVSTTSLNSNSTSECGC